MTFEEQQQYDSLPYEDKLEYDHTRRKHPSWSHEQIINKVAIVHKIEVVTSNGSGNVNPNDPNILKEIFEGAKEFLEDVGIVIGAVFELIDEALTTIGGWISNGIDYIGDKVSQFWDWLWD